MRSSVKAELLCKYSSPNLRPSADGKSLEQRLKFLPRFFPEDGLVTELLGHDQEDAVQTHLVAKSASAKDGHQILTTVVYDPDSCTIARVIQKTEVLISYLLSLGLRVGTDVFVQYRCSSVKMRILAVATTDIDAFKFNIHILATQK